MAETCQQLIARKSKNSWFQAVGLYQKSGKLAKVKATKLQLQKYKESFGVQYMDMLNKGSSEKELQDYLSTSRKDILDLEERISILKMEAKNIDERTKRKIKVSPAKPPNSALNPPGTPQSVEATEMVVDYSDGVAQLFSDEKSEHKLAPAKQHKLTENSYPRPTSNSSHDPPQEQTSALAVDNESDFVIVDSSTAPSTPSAPPASMDV